MTLVCEGMDLSGVWHTLPAPISLQYKMQLFSPAAAATVRFAGIPYAGALRQFKLTLNGTLLLHATADILRQSCSGSSGVTTTLTGRDLVAAGMLDNEVEPGYRFQFGRDQLLADHAIPWGATGSDLPAGQINYIIFTRLMNHFDAINLYCQQTYDSTYVFLGRDHKLRLEPFRSTVRRFSPGGAYPYHEAELSFNRKQVYSKFYIETKRNDYDYEFNDEAVNAVAGEYGVTRVSYYSPSQKWYRAPKKGAQHLLAQSRRDIKRVTLTLPGAYIFEAGEKATLTDPRLGTMNNLYIYEHRLDIGSKGATTAVVLCEQAYV